MKRIRKILLAVFAACFMLCVAIVGSACHKDKPEEQKPTYAVTYTLGSCGETAYAGESALPTETEKAEGASFTLAAAPVWEGYIFLGWNDGEQTYNASAKYTMPAHAVALTATWKEEEPVTYAVTYVFGSCDDTAYAGTSTLPTETEKTAGATFSLASAPVWTGYSFDGWSDGTDIYDAGEEYTMPAHAVTFTALWEDYPEGHVRDTGIDVPTWNEGVTEGGYKIEKGQQVQITAHISNKGTSDSASGLAGKLIANCDVDRGANGNFYQCRPDFIVKRNNWDWNENNNGLNVNDTGWNRETWRTTTEGDIVITVALGEDGVLSYTVEFTSENYSHKREFTTKDTMDSALVFFGADNCTITNASIIYPSTNGVKLSFDWNYNDQVDTKNVEVNSTYTIEFNATRTGYMFLGWQVNGAGAYYKNGDSYSVGKKQVRFIAAWVEDIAITIDKDGGTGSVSKPKYSYNQETGKFDIADVPSPYYLKKTDHAFKCWEVTVNGVVTDVDGAFSVDPGAAVVFKAIWGDKLTLTYSLGSCDGTSYGGATKTPGAVDRAEGGTVTLTAEPKAWAGYRFLGWSDGETTYEPGATYTMPDHNVTITAQWEALPRYSVTYLPGSCDGTEYGGQNLIDEQEDTYEGATFPLARAIKWDGYTFKGWSDGTTTYAAMFRYTMPDHAVTFTAVWEKIPTHTVTYVKGTTDEVLNMPAADTYYEGQMLRTLPIRFGYTFKGWSDGTNVYQTGETLPTAAGNLTLTAQWEEVEDSRLVILSGVWELEDEDGTIYFPFSGTQTAWDAFDAFGSYIAGTYEVTSVTDTQIKFTMVLTRGASGTTRYSGTYYFDSDVISLNYGFRSVTLHRSTDKPETNGGTVDTAKLVLDSAVVPARKETVD